MTTTFTKMTRHSIALFMVLAIAATGLFNSCTKNEETTNNSNQPSTYSADVLDKWIAMQIRLMKNATGIPNQAFSRHYAYTGIAALESLAPGLPAHANWSGKWNGLTGLPVPDHSVHYYYTANINAAMATMNRSLFPNASSADKAAIDSLETALNQSFLA